MNDWFLQKQPLIIAALHLAPLPGSQHPNAQPIQTVIDLARRNAEKAVRAGVPALYIQDVADEPVARGIQPYTIASMAVIGAALRREFPDLMLGVCMMSHGAREPIAAAQAIGAQFVRIKVYVGVMVKAEGLLEGLAYEAVQYRAQIGAQDIAILADVYDRTGQPLGRMPLADEARQAAVFGRADGLVLTGASLWMSRLRCWQACAKPTGRAAAARWGCNCREYRACSENRGRCNRVKHVQSRGRLDSIVTASGVG
jgi:uncharacterized protein